MKRVMAVAVIALAGCSPTEPARITTAQSDAAKESAWIAEMQVRVRAQLRDPGSAQFRNTRVSRAGGVPAVCGEVNSNNGLGGKAGFQRFVAAGDIQVLEEQMEPGSMDEVWLQFCS